MAAREGPSRGGEGSRRDFGGLSACLCALVFWRRLLLIGQGVTGAQVADDPACNVARPYRREVEPVGCPQPSFAVANLHRGEVTAGRAGGKLPSRQIALACLLHCRLAGSVCHRHASSHDLVAGDGHAEVDKPRTVRCQYLYKLVHAGLVTALPVPAMNGCDDPAFRTGDGLAVVAPELRQDKVRVETGSQCSGLFEPVEVVEAGEPRRMAPPAEHCHAGNPLQAALQFDAERALDGGGSDDEHPADDRCRRVGAAMRCPAPAADEERVELRRCRLLRLGLRRRRVVGRAARPGRLVRRVTRSRAAQPLVLRLRAAAVAASLGCLHLFCTWRFGLLERRRRCAAELVVPAVPQCAPAAQRPIDPHRLREPGCGSDHRRKQGGLAGQLRLTSK